MRVQLFREPALFGGIVPMDGVAERVSEEAHGREVVVFHDLHHRHGRTDGLQPGSPYTPEQKLYGVPFTSAVLEPSVNTTVAAPS
jgi:hypothetical protein